MNPRSARPAGRHPRSHRKCQPSVVPVSLVLPRLANKDFVSPVYSLSWSLHSLIQHLRSHAHPQFVSIWTICLPRGSGSSDSFISTSQNEDRVGISSVNSGDGEPTDMVMDVSRIQTLDPPQSPVTSHSQLVVESLSHNESAAVPISITALVESMHLSHISAGLMVLNFQVLEQYITSLNHMSS